MAQAARRVAAPDTPAQPEKPGKIIAGLIRARREELKIGQGELAAKVGAHPQTMNKIERGEIVFSRFFPLIEAALEMPEGTLTRAAAPGATIERFREVSQRGGDQDRNQLDSRSALTKASLLSPLEMPLFSSASNSEGTMALSAQAVGVTAVPAPLVGVRDAYAFLVSGDTMVPAYRPGDTIWLNPHLPIEDHKDVLLRRANGNGDEVVLAHLTKHTATHWEVVEHGATRKSKGRKVARKEYPHCHRVVGKLCR